MVFIHISFKHGDGHNTGLLYDAGISHKRPIYTSLPLYRRSQYFLCEALHIHTIDELMEWMSGSWRSSVVPGNGWNLQKPTVCMANFQSPGRRVIISSSSHKSMNRHGDDEKHVTSMSQKVKPNDGPKMSRNSEFHSPIYNSPRTNHELVSVGLMWNFPKYRPFHFS